MRERIVPIPVLLALLSACQMATPTPPTTGPPSATPSSTPTTVPEPSFSSDLQPIYQTVRDYLTAYDAWGANPTNDFTPVTQFTIDDAQNLVVEVLVGRRQDGIRVEGQPLYRNWTIYTLDPLPDGTSRARVELCSDNAKMIIVAKDGSRSPAKGTFLESYILRQVTDKTWRIADYSNKEQPC